MRRASSRLMTWCLLSGSHNILHLWRMMLTVLTALRVAAGSDQLGGTDNKRARALHRQRTPARAAHSTHRPHGPGGARAETNGEGVSAFQPESPARAPLDSRPLDDAAGRHPLADKRRLSDLQTASVSRWAVISRRHGSDDSLTCIPPEPVRSLVPTTSLLVEWHVAVCHAARFRHIWNVNYKAFRVSF